MAPPPTIQLGRGAQEYSQWEGAPYSTPWWPPGYAQSPVASSPSSPPACTLGGFAMPSFPQSQAWDSQPSQPSSPQAVVRLPAGSRLILGGVVVEAVGSPREGSPPLLVGTPPTSNCTAPITPTALPAQEILDYAAGNPGQILIPVEGFSGDHQFVENPAVTQEGDGASQDCRNTEAASQRSSFAPGSEIADENEQRPEQDMELDEGGLGRLPTFARLATADVDILLEDLVRFPSMIAKVAHPNESIAQNLSADLDNDALADEKIKEGGPGRYGSLELFAFDRTGAEDPQDAFNLN